MVNRTVRVRPSTPFEDGEFVIRVEGGGVILDTPECEGTAITPTQAMEVAYALIEAARDAERAQRG